MKSFLFTLALSISTLTATHAADAKISDSQDEVAKIDLLIEATNANLTRLKALKVLLVEYKQTEVQALKDPNDSDNLLKLVNLAKEIQDNINDSALQDYFAPQFLEELKKFAAIADKKNIPQAK